MSCFEIPVSLCKRIQSALTRFFWDGTDQKRKMCWVSWPKLTLPKENGGLGFRDIQLFNQALLAKVAWRILVKPNCLLARVLKGKYCHNKHFLEAPAPSSCSHGWRSIVSGRDLLKSNLGKAIGNGNTTKVWHDTWISVTEDIKPFGPIQEEALDLRVSDLLTTELQWNTKRIKELLPELVDKIQRIHPSKMGEEDCYIWRPSQSGIYTTKSGYNSMALERASTLNPLQPQSEFKWYRDVWSAPAPPKLKVFLWSCIQRAIPVGENLETRGIRTNIQCRRCGEAETTTHLLFSCPFAQNVWGRIQTGTTVHLAVIEDLRDALVKFRNVHCLPPSGVVGNILPWVCWQLWTARNKLIFENRDSLPEEIATRSLTAAREWEQAQQKEANQPEKQTKQSLPRSETRQGTIVCNTDASWHQSSQRAGLAWIFKGLQPSQLSKGSLTQDFVTSPLMAEAMAIRSALQMAATLDLTDLVVCSDNQTLTRAISNMHPVKEIFGILADINLLRHQFDSISFIFIPRSQNEEADSLAKSTLGLSSSMSVTRPFG